MTTFIVLSLALGGTPDSDAIAALALAKAARERVVTTNTAPAVAASTFRNGSYHAGHDCPTCGRETTRIGNDAGPTHTHVCPYDGTEWHHVDAVSTGPTLKVVRRLFGR